MRALSDLLAPPHAMIPFDTATERYFSLLEHLQQAVIVTDPVGRVLRWSDTAEALYGWPADEAVGQNILDLTPSELSCAQGEEIMKTLNGGQVWSGAFPVRARDGKRFSAFVTDVPLLDDRATMVGIVGASAPDGRRDAGRLRREQ